MKKRDEYLAALAKLRAMDERYGEAKSEGERQMLRIVQWVLALWKGENQTLLEQTLSPLKQ